MARKQAMMRLMDATFAAGVRIDNVAVWCRANGVNPRTFYRHRARAAEEGQWQPRSRRPRSSPAATPPEVVAEVLRLRAALAPDNGAERIGAELAEVAAGGAGHGLSVPSRATINRILDRHGLLIKNPAKRPRASWRRFAYARPRDCYQIDGTEHVLADGSKVIAIDVLDDCSRMWVASRVAATETTAAAVAAIRAAVAGFGAPALVLADNGAAFAHRDRGRPSRFGLTLAEQHGSRVIHSSPYHPQTLGKNERLHGTAKKLLAHRWPTPAATPAELQARLDSLRVHYNTVRRHSALGQHTPEHAWRTAASHGGPGNLPRQTDATVHRLHVFSNGTISLSRTTLHVGRTHIGTTVTAIRDGNHVTIYNHHGQPLGTLTLQPDRRYQGRITPAA